MSIQSADQPSPQSQTTGDQTIFSVPLRAGTNYVQTDNDVLKIVAQTYYGCDANRYEARDYAHLFAAAPALLKACEDCMENRGDWAAVMGDAIDKARGRS